MSTSAASDAWFDLLPNGVVVQDESGTVLRCNQAALIVLDLTVDQLSGRAPYHPEWHAVNEDLSPFAGLEHPTTKALATGLPILGVLMGVFHPSSAQYRWVRVSAHPGPGPSGSPQVLTLYEDVTDWKRATDNSRLERQLFEQGPVVVLQRRGSPGQLVYISENFQTVLGLHPAPFLTGEQDLWDRIHPDDRVRLDTQWKTIRAGGKFSELTGQFRFRVGSEDWRRIDYRTIYEAGGPGREASTLGYWIDRTDESENHLRLAMTLEAARTGTWEWVRSVDRLIVDNEWLRLLGIPEQERDTVTMDQWSALIHPAEAQEWRRTMGEIGAGDVVAFDLKLRQRRRSGEWVWTRVRGKTFEFTSDGRAYRVLGTQEDINEAIQSEEERLVLSQVVEQGQSAVVITDLAGTIEYVNQQFTVLSGYTLNEVQGKNPRILKSPHTTPETVLDLWSALKAGKPWFGEIQNLRKDGTMYWAQTSISPISDASGRVYRYVGQHIDISARKGVEEGSRAQYRFQLFLTQVSARLVNVRGEVVPQALRETLGDLGVHFQADRVFLAFLTSTGMLAFSDGWDRSGAALPSPVSLAEAPLWRKRIVSREAILSVGLPSPVPWSSRPVAALLTVPLEGGGGEAGILVLEAATVRPAWTPEVQISVTVVANTLSAFLKRLVDDENVKRARLEAEQANQAKTDFLAHMSHEIRTPMNGILGLAELALTREMDAEARPLVEGIKASGETLLALVNDILDVSKIEAGKLELEKTDFSLKEVVATTIASLQVLAAKKGLEIKPVLGNLPEGRQGDPTRIRQILTNLVGNAVKFTPSGEVTVLVEPGEHEVDVLFKVRDTGPGVPADRQGRLFQRYSQMESSTTRKFGGTGLGLAICRELVDHMGGAIGYVDADSPPGGLFWFTLPLPLSTALQKPPVAAEPLLQMSNLRVLVVEDNLVNQQVAAGLLRRHGVEPQLASDGSQALERLRGSDFDLVLMDVQMPVLDGLATTQAVRRGEGGEHHRTVPIVAMTANAMQGDKEASVAAGMDDYVTKPISAAKLASLLEKWSLPPASQTADRTRRTFDHAEMRERLQLEEDFVHQIVQLFLDDLPSRRSGLVEALAEGKIEDLLRLAHNLKGTAANLVAQAVVDAAQELEAAAGRKDMKAVARIHPVVLAEIDLLQAALADFLR